MTAMSDINLNIQKNNHKNAQLFMNRYKLIKKIGNGQFGTVWAARDMSVHKDSPSKRVAVKLVKYDPNDIDDEIENIITKTII